MTTICAAYRPLVYRKIKFNEFAKMHSGAIFVDAFSKQIQELFFIDNPDLADKNKSEIFQSQEFQKYAADRRYLFVYVYYPWNNHIVKTIQDKDYFRLKTNRNRDLITLAEQERLSKYRVAVFGMSVGSNIVSVLTQAGISKKITIADFDDLDATNLNRIFGGVHQIGLNKCVLAARRIYEDNPFAKVNVLTAGITEKNLSLLLEQKKIDCVVDEIDDIPMKIAMRKLAMKYKVPVLMVTDNGDGIVLHIERYDLDYKKIFHHNLRYWQKKMQQFAMEKGGKKKIAGDIIMNDIVGGARFIDPKMLVSVKKVLDKELVSWSQLGSAAMLGGVYVTFALKQIIIGKDRRKEIRAYINPHF